MYRIMIFDEQYNIWRMLELASDVDIGFTYKNTLYTKDLSVDRSTVINIPRTKDNDIALDFASEVYGDGDSMRRKYRATLNFSGGILHGELVLSNITKSGYSCTFYYGGNSIFKRIENAGKITSYIDPADSVMWGSSSVVNDGGYVGPLPYDFAIYKYKISDNLMFWHNQDSQYLPTVKFSYLLDLCSSYFGVNWDIDSSDYNDRMDYLQRVGVKLSGMNKQLTLSMSADRSSFGYTSYIMSSDNRELLTNENLLPVRYYGGGYTTRISYLYSLQAVTDCRVDMTYLNSGFCVLKNEMEIIDLPTPFSFYLKKGEYFNVIHTSNFPYYNINDFAFITNFFFNVSGVRDIQFNEYYDLTTNLPDVTFLDLLKTAASLLSCGLYYNESNNTIYLYGQSTGSQNTNIKVLDLILLDSGITGTYRYVDGYGKRNVWDFKSNTQVLQTEKVANIILMSNESLSEEELIYTIPFSEERSDFSQYDNVFIDDYERKEARDSNGVLQSVEYKKIDKGDALVMYNDRASSLFLKRINFYGNTELANVLSVPTVIKFSVRMPLYEFLEIKHVHTYSFRSLRWALLEGKWKNGVCEGKWIKVK